MWSRSVFVALSVAALGCAATPDGPIGGGIQFSESIEFDGPVTDTLRQVFERFDGAGKPDGRAGADILVEARILAVCNAFVAMASPRAHRQRFSVDAALDALHGDVGKAFDRGVVAALINYLDNKGGRTAFETAATSSSKTAS